MPEIHQVWHFKASIDHVYRALTDEQLIKQWCGDDATFENKVGGKFIFWGGDIFGENIQLVQNKKIVQSWAALKWHKPSQVIFTLAEVKGQTILHLDHVRIPKDANLTDYDDGWRTYYEKPIRELVEK